MKFWGGAYGSRWILAKDLEQLNVGKQLDLVPFADLRLRFHPAPCRERHHRRDPSGQPVQQLQVAPTWQHPPMQLCIAGSRPSPVDSELAAGIGKNPGHLVQNMPGENKNVGGLGANNFENLPCRPPRTLGADEDVRVKRDSHLRRRS